LASAFSRRSASEIKRKFVRENKQNPSKIDQLLLVHSTGESSWDVAHLLDQDVEFNKKLEEMEDDKKVRKEKRIQRQIESNRSKIIFFLRNFHINFWYRNFTKNGL
jgi:hypothetical protein